MNKQFWFSKKLWREYLSFQYLSTRSEYLHWREIRDKKISGQPVIIVPGFKATPKYYAPLLAFLKNNQINASAVDTGNKIFHLNNYLSQLSQSVDKLILIGHSLGGLQSLAVLDKFPKISRIITIGSPYSGGTPWKTLQIIIVSFIKVDAKEFRASLPRALNHVPSYVDKITTISSKRDVIAPPEHCFIPGAENIVFDENDEILNSHLGLPFFPPVQKLILDKIKKELMA